MSKKPWTQGEADALVAALSPIAAAFSFSVEIGNKAVPDPKAPEYISFEFKPLDPKAPDLNTDTAKILCWMRDVWGKPSDTIKNGPFNPFTFLRGRENVVAPPPMPNPAQVRRRAVPGGENPFRELARGAAERQAIGGPIGGGAGNGGGGIDRVVRMAGGAGAIVVENMEHAAEAQHLWADPPPPPQPQIMAGFNEHGQAVNPNGDILQQQLDGNWVIAIPNPDQYFGDAPTKKGKDPAPRFHYAFTRNDGGIVYARVW